MSVEGQSETSALDLGVAASTLKPDNPAPEKRGLTLQLGLQKGSKPDGRDALRLGSREPGAALAARAQTKSRKTKFRDWVSARQRFEPNLEFPPLRIPAMC